MASKKLQILFSVILSGSFYLSTSANAFAAINNLNGQTGNNQTFANDTNVKITSASNTHTLGWQGLLGISRGGTNASSFTTGSIFFYNGSAFSQDNSNFFWDNTNKRLGVGTSSPTNTLSVNGNQNVTGNLNVTGTISASNFNPTSYVPYTGATGNVNLGANSLTVGTITSPSISDLIPYTGASNDVNFGNHTITFGSQNGNSYIYGTNATSGGANGSTLNFNAGDGGGGGDGGGAQLVGGDGYNGGYVALEAGWSNDGLGSGTGGDVFLQAGSNYYSNNPGKVYIKDPISSLKTIFQTSTISSTDKTFTFPNASGTFGLLQSDQTWSGLNKLEDSADTTLYIGSSSLTGCIALGDSDGSGITYITANDGVLSASSTKPANCQ